MAQPSAQSPRRLMALQLLLWHSILWAGQEAAPLVSVTSLPPPLPLPRSFLLKSLEQVRKIQAGNSVLLEKLVSSTKCLSQLHRGLFLYQGLLQALAGISPELAPTLDTLQLDVANFATTIWQQMENLGVAPTAQPTQGTMPTFTSAFQRRAGGVLATSHLQRFLETAHCALNHLVQP
ncbi:granulocyte colony-stimulating factor-like isoform X3 [Microtus oregoni]|uniref:granulocyte colony-stimulating factor-like isoform X3 n=1 Tax=Microtus oregoni TaxID=111838 RepID=UPI001BB2CCF4|nr:granulocyte colony-stimulating factor-like isoform X3 [Microtus oregoni]XP_041521863.1 granulocyte colony-stimulating factor-like isoform X3 [Microtus oregoni]